MNDLKFAFRQLLKNPGFTAVAVLTLALGIGANTAIFSVVNAVLLRPLPYPESDRLVWLSERGRNFPVMSISWPNFADWRAQQNVFEHIGVYNWTSFGLTGDGGEPLRLQVSRISAGALAAVRVEPMLGRIFGDEDDKPGAAATVVLSYALWQSRFAANPNVLSQTISLDGRPFTVIGVMPRNFAFPNVVDVWVPLGLFVAESNYQSRGNHPGLLGVARLKPGVTLEQARTEMDVIAARLEQQYPDSNRTVRVRIEPLIENQVGTTARIALWTLLGAVAMVLLIACGNVANLLLARGAARQREMAVRAALGAGRWRIVRQLLTESLLLALAGGALGLLIGKWGLRLLLAISDRDAIPRADEIDLSFGVLLFTGGMAVVTGIVFGLAPAWQASRSNLQESLQETSRSTTGGRARLRQALVVAEVALTLMLLVGAGLMLRSFHRVQTLNPGFSHEGVLSFRLDLPRRKYATDEQQIAFFQQLTERLRALPGVQAAAFGSQIPLAKNGWQTSYRIEGQPEPLPGESPSVELTVASPDYFSALGISLLRGRYFTDEDNRDHVRGRDFSGTNSGRWAASVNVIIVDEEFARRHWPNEDPIGQRVRLNAATLKVVGVVRRVKLGQLDEQGGFVQGYLSALQSAARGQTITVKSSTPPEGLIASIRQQVLALDPDQPIYDIRSLSELRDRALTPKRLTLTLLSIFAAVALTLAVIGLYGVLAYAVTQRTREIGIRVALGAQRRNVLALIVRHGMRLALVGAFLGLLGALCLTRWLSSLLYEITPTDPLTLLVTASILLAVALVACWLPARRAARTDPMVALRYE